MTDTVVATLLILLGWWTLLSIAYRCVLFVLNALSARWQRRQEVRRRHLAAIAQIDRDAEITCARLGAAFIVAQQRIRDEAAAARAGRS